ncbi:SU10 major capsid protein [Paludisphaera soli]|uniref:SU10 major capsid protein n=1 Tax=Paludisphaera soli TaxID=2712865 RepID=UPI0013E9F03C|nr:DUF5309 family protein [Paludisphaera soli]
MPNSLVGGPFPALGNLDTTTVDMYAVARAEYINLMPFSTRLPTRTIDGPSWEIVSDLPLLRKDQLNGAIASNATTAFVVDDASVFDVDDVIQVSTEYLLVTAVNAGTNTLTVTRGYAGTTALASIADNTAVNLITNTRNGAAVDIPALQLGQQKYKQWVQNIQHAYSVGGSAITNRNFVSADGNALDRDRANALRRTMRDLESGIVYGKRVALAANTPKPMMGGINEQIVTNRADGPSDAAAYKPSSFVRDIFQKVVDGNGYATHCFVSTDWLTAFATWKFPTLPYNVGTTELNVEINAFKVSWMPQLIFVPAPMLRKGTAIAINIMEAYLGIKQPMIDQPRGLRGYAREGDVIVEAAVGLENESHHAIVTGITGYAEE